MPIGLVCSFLAYVLAALAAAQIWFPEQLASRAVTAPAGTLGPALLQMGGATMLLCMNVLWVLSVRPAPLHMQGRSAAGQCLVTVQMACTKYMLLYLQSRCLVCIPCTQFTMKAIARTHLHLDTCSASLGKLAHA